MWPWLRNGRFKNFFVLTDRQKFFCKLCLLTGIGHVLILLVGTCSYFDFNEHERFVISSRHGNTVYVLTPLQKQVKSSVVKQSDKSLVQSSKVIDYGTYEQLKQQQEKQLTKKNTVKAQPVEVKKTSKALTSSLAALQEVHQSKQKKPQITISETKVAKKITAEKKIASPISKKITVVKEQKKLQNKHVGGVKKEEAVQPLKQEVSEQKGNNSKDSVVQQNDISESSTKSMPVVESAQNIGNVHQDVVVANDIDLDHVTFIGYEQLDSLAVQNKIQQMVQQNFKCPIGIKKDVSCELTVLVGDSGRSKAVTMVRSSGILIYDTSARAMLYKIEFPKEVWNKTITIVLGQ